MGVRVLCSEFWYKGTKAASDRIDSSVDFCLVRLKFTDRAFNRRIYLSMRYTCMNNVLSSQNTEIYLIVQCRIREMFL